MLANRQTNKHARQNTGLLLGGGIMAWYDGAAEQQTQGQTDRQRETAAFVWLVAIILPQFHALQYSLIGLNKTAGRMRRSV